METIVSSLCECDALYVVLFTVNSLDFVLYSIKHFGVIVRFQYLTCFKSVYLPLNWQNFATHTFKYQ